MSDGAPSLQRDEDTIALWTEFLDESHEHLTAADALLLKGVDAAGINALFRGFHSIKGLAGFCGLPQVQQLAHATETVLGAARSGALAADQPLLDLVLDATGLMRDLLKEVHRALRTSTEVVDAPDVPALLARLHAVAPLKSVQAPAVSPSPPTAAPPAPASHQPPAQSHKSMVPGQGPGVSDSAPTAAPPASVSPQPAAEIHVRETLRVDVERVERLVELIGELVVVQSMLAASPELVAASGRVRQRLEYLGKISREVQGAAMRVRMIPIRDTFQRMVRAARDLSRQTGKNTILHTVGGETELDRSVVEKLESPLMHLLRNSMDHGLEPEADRRAAGKSAQGTLTLSAWCEGGTVVVELKDDGRGLSRERIAARGIERGLLKSAEGVSDDQLYGLIFLPGFSTSAAVTELSGRGVGMDAVRSAVEAMRGRVEVTSTPGQGVTFRLVLPLTTAIIDVVQIRVAAEDFLLPSLSVQQLMVLTPGLLVTRGERELLRLPGGLAPVFRLGPLFGAPAGEAKMAVIVHACGRRAALLVDNAIGQLQAVMKPLSGSADAPYFSGAAVLPNGELGLLIDPDRVAPPEGFTEGLGPFAPAAPKETHP